MARPTQAVRSDAVKRVGVVANCGKPRAAAALRRLGESAGRLGLKLFADRVTARILKPAGIVPPEKMIGRIDALMALGGDGTMLRAVRLLNGRDIPVLGVNLGALGFLTSVAEEDMERAVEGLACGGFTTSTRSVAECLVRRRGRTVGRYRALNDAVIHNAASGRVIVLNVSIDGEKMCTYVCDGLIVSTPTGSTGHSLSAGGPILHPSASAFIINLICPHVLSSRPIVVPDSGVIDIVVAESSGGSRLSIDGQVGQSLSLGDGVRIRRSPKSVRFVHLPGHSYFDLLRHKLHLRGSNV